MKILGRIVIALSAASLVTGLVAATGDVVADRQAMMKQMAGSMGGAGKIAQGAAPWDADAAHAFGALVATDAKALHAMFPEGSQSLPGSKAKPELWQNKGDLDQRLTDLETAAAGVQKAQTADEFKLAFQSVGQTCRGCHTLYRG